MEKPTATASPPRRPWYRLHLSTWLILPLAIIAAVFVELPGGVGGFPERPAWSSMVDKNAIVHGWPLPYLWRTPKGWTGDPAKAARSLPWKLTVSVRQFQVSALLVDLAVAIAGVAVFATLLEWRRRHRLRAFQFTLRELLIFAMLLATGFGFWNHLHATDREVTERLGRIGGGTDGDFVPRLPLWLRTAVGDESLSRLGVNGPQGEIALSWGLSKQKDIRYIVERYPHEARVEIDNTASRDVAAAVGAIDRLEQIECIYLSPADLTRLLKSLERHPRLRDFIFVGGHTKINDDQLAQIATFPQLEALSIRNDASQLTERGLAELQKCMNLKSIALHDMRLTEDALVRLCAFSQLRQLDLGGAQFINADLSLRRLDGLEEIRFGGNESWRRRRPPIAVDASLAVSEYFSHTNDQNRCQRDA